VAGSLAGWSSNVLGVWEKKEKKVEKKNLNHVGEGPCRRRRCLGRRCSDFS
jgi:hypothetical protein